MLSISTLDFRAASATLLLMATLLEMEDGMANVIVGTSPLVQLPDMVVPGLMATWTLISLSVLVTRDGPIRGLPRLQVTSIDYGNMCRLVPICLRAAPLALIVPHLVVSTELLLSPLVMQLMTLLLWEIANRPAMHRCFGILLEPVRDTILRAPEHLVLFLVGPVLVAIGLFVEGVRARVSAVIVVRSCATILATRVTAVFFPTYYYVVCTLNIGTYTYVIDDVGRVVNSC